MKKIFLFIFLLVIVYPDSCFAHKTVGFLIPASGLGDQSFNDMTYAGLIQAKNDLNLTLQREQCILPNLKSRSAALEKLIDQGADIIVTNGWEFKVIVEEYAPQYPDLRFIVNDIPVPGFPNVISTVFSQHEGSFLAGALAAWQSETGKIGFIGGQDMPVIRAFQTGYREGALYAKADIQFFEVFLSDKDGDASGFDNPELGYEEANDLYKNGVDIIFSVAGLSGNGIIQAAVENKRFTIGVDADQDYMAKGYVLTSVMKRLDLATFEVIRLIVKDHIYSGVYSFGLEENGISLSPMTYTKHLIADEKLVEIERLRTKVIKGEISVTNSLYTDLY